MAQRKKTKKKTSFVPRVVFATAMVGAGVIPLCVTACGGNISQGSRDSGLSGVAADGFPLPRGVADSGFADGVAVDSFMRGVADSGFGVADVGFDGVAVDAFGVFTDAFGVAIDAFGVADTTFSVADTGFSVADTGFSVADTGFKGDTGAEGGEPVDGGEG